MARLRYNGLTATLGAALTSGGTTITLTAALTHSGGTAVPTITGSDYIPLTILTTAGAVSEIVYLTAYTSGATTGTIARGQEGTAGVAHSSGDNAVHGLSVADVIDVGAWTNLTMASGFTSHADNFGYVPAYRKVGDVVHLRGTVRPTSGSFTGGSSYTLATLPAGFRPPAGPVTGVVYGVGGASGIALARLEVLSDGSLKVVPNATTTWVSIDSMRFAIV